MAKAKRYTDAQIEAARKNLRSLAKKNNDKTRKQVAEILAEDIRKAVRQGYSLEEVRDILTDSGVSVSVAQMRVIVKNAAKKVEEEIIVEENQGF